MQRTLINRYDKSSGLPGYSSLDNYLILSPSIMAIVDDFRLPGVPRPAETEVRARID